MSQPHVENARGKRQVTEHGAVPYAVRDSHVLFSHAQSIIDSLAPFDFGFNCSLLPSITQQSQNLKN